MRPTCVLAALASLCLSPLARADSAIRGALSEGLRGKVQLVFVERAEGAFTAQPAEMDQKDNTYLPRVLPVVVGATVTFKSSDPDLHNVFARGADHHVLFNQAVLPHLQMIQTFRKEGVVKITCNVHKNMLAFIPVLQNPFFAKPDAQGRFRIQGVPAGHYVLRVWGEGLDPATLARTFPVDVADGAASQVQIACN